MPGTPMIPALVGMAFLFAAPLTSQATDFAWSGSVAENGWIKIYNGNGPIDVVPATGDSIEVVGKRGSRTGDGDPVRFEILTFGSGVVICTVTDYTECRDDGLHGTARNHDNHPERIRFTVRLPSGAHAGLSTGNGDLRVENAGGDIRARTGNGRVQLSGTSGTVEVSSGNGALEIGGAAGPVRATTGNGRVTIRTSTGPVHARSGNGRIFVDMESLRGNGDLEFRTGSGDIELYLPAGLGADLVTRLGNGRLVSDFPLLVQGRTNFRNLRATLGEGGRRLIVASGNGDAVLRRR